MIRVVWSRICVFSLRERRSPSVVEGLERLLIYVRASSTKTSLVRKLIWQRKEGPRERERKGERKGAKVSRSGSFKSKIP
jgi:hypothetical protein